MKGWVGVRYMFFGVGFSWRMYIPLVTLFIFSLRWAILIIHSRLHGILVFEEKNDGSGLKKDNYV